MLKPIDTAVCDFLARGWSGRQLANFVCRGRAVGNSAYVGKLTTRLENPARGLEINVSTIFSAVSVLRHLCGTVIIMYSVMIALVLNQHLVGSKSNAVSNFWFYITNFYRYPMEIYQRHGIGWALWGTFTFVVPILVVSNVPARVFAQPSPGPSVWEPWEWYLAGYTLFATIGSVLASRWVFKKALSSYRSASS